MEGLPEPAEISEAVVLEGRRERVTASHSIIARWAGDVRRLPRGVLGAIRAPEPGDAHPTLGAMTENGQGGSEQDGDRLAGHPLCVFAPWPVVTVTVEASLADGDDDIHVQAGGQGMWVARMAASLGATVTLVGPFDDASGRAAEAMLRDEGVALRRVAARGSNGGYVHDRRAGERREVARMPSARLDRHEPTTSWTPRWPRACAAACSR